MNRRITTPVAWGVAVVVVVGAIVMGPNYLKVRKAKALVAEKLIDPSSAQFRRVQVVPQPYDKICGEINGKNRLGAYVGFSRFVVQGELVTIQPQESSTYSPKSELDETFSDLRRLTWESAELGCKWNN